MKPLFLGDARRRLYGVYHAPARTSRHAVLLCYPGIQEYNSSHWAYRRLASMLARDGHHVLRFDYFGTGDSAGRVEEAEPQDWLDDIRQAAAELLDISGARELSLLGKRLGASLATLVCQQGLKVNRLALWDPVVRGADYVAELEVWDSRRNLLLLHADQARQTGRSEMLGYPFSTKLRHALQGLDITGRLPLHARKIAVFASDAHPAYQGLCDALLSSGHNAKLSTAPSADGGGEPDLRGNAELSGSILSQLTEELRGALSE